MSEADAEVTEPEVDANPANDEGEADDAKTLGEGGGSGQEAAPQADWPEDWRQKMAGEDEKSLKKLTRYSSPMDLMKAHRALEQKMSSGDLKAALPEDATDEQVAKWRSENGIPEKSEGYLDSLPEALVIGEDDREMVNSFLESAHATNASPEVVGNAVNWFFAEKEKRVAELHESDGEYKSESEEVLRTEWGADFKDNINVFKSFIDQAPEGIRDLIRQGRLADGTVIGNNPDFLKWIVATAKDINPASTVVPGSAGQGIDGVNEEISKIEDLMRSNRAAYNKDEKMQAHYRRLLEAQEKMSARAA